MKLSKTVKNGQALTQVSKKSLEPQIDGEHLEGAFSDPSMDTLLQGFILRAGPPKDIEKYDDETIRGQQVFLEIFLNALLKIPDIANSEVLATFLFGSDTGG